jgi:hypothetical protein
MTVKQRRRRRSSLTSRNAYLESMTTSSSKTKKKTMTTTIPTSGTTSLCGKNNTSIPSNPVDSQVTQANPAESYLESLSAATAALAALNLGESTLTSHSTIPFPSNADEVSPNPYVEEVNYVYLPGTRIDVTFICSRHLTYPFPTLFVVVVLYTYHYYSYYYRKQSTMS